ncbi:MAG: hypothetical protein ACRYG5_09940 [Janthinobacterium lividum]
MSTIKVEGFIHARKESWETEFSYHFWKNDDMSDCGYVLVRPHTLEFDLPVEFNPIAAQVDALEKQKTKLGEEFAARVRQINEQISKLQCIEYAPSGEAAAVEVPSDDGGWI